MRKLDGKFARKKRWLVGLIGISLATSHLSSARAVTYPTEVENAGRLFPYVAQIWISTDANESSSFLCSGTLIKADLVLTAAHCARALAMAEVDRTWISLGSDDYNPSDNDYYSNIDSVWWNPRFSSETLANDIGLILLSEAVDSRDARPLPLSTPAIYSASKSLASYSIYGWGLDQNGDEPAVLQRSSLTLQEKAAKKYYKSQFNPITMIAAGKWNANERTYSGGCNGDSGGPLIGSYKGKAVLLGVTSYVSSKGCDTGQPTVFARVSYFLNDLTAGEKRVRSQVAFVNSYNVVDKSIYFMNSLKSGMEWSDFSSDYTASNSLGSIRTSENDCQLLIYNSERDLRSDFDETGNSDDVYAEYGTISYLSNFWFLLRASASDVPCFVTTKSNLDWDE
jgi:secreted trypsin-like serine protease